MTSVCICGGGSLAHVCAGVLASQNDVSVNVLTRHPEKWSHHMEVTDCMGKVYAGHLSVISDIPSEALQGCDIVFCCLPGFALAPTLEKIKAYIGKAVVGSIVSSTGFFFDAHRILGETSALFGFQRVPFIARTVDYGHSANLLGYKSQVAIAVENIEDKESFRALVEKLWQTPTYLLGTYYEAALTNSNPILHTGRLYSMWSTWNGEVFDHNVLFYKEWTVEASRLILAMDREFMCLLDVLPVTKGAVPSLLDYYESHDAESLTRKISSIPAFQQITSPMKEVEGGWVPDFSSRYFTEDFPFGLKYIVELTQKYNIPSPYLQKVFEWGMDRCVRSM